MTTRARYALRLVAELVAYARVHREWWLLAVVVLLAAVVALVALGHAAAPFSLYTLF